MARLAKSPSGPEPPDSLRAELGDLLKRSKSPLTRKIIAFNLVALSLLVTGILYLNQTRESLISLRKRTLAAETTMITMSLAQNLNMQGKLDVGTTHIFTTMNALAAPANARAELFSADGQLLSKPGSGHSEALYPVTITVERQQNTVTDIVDGATQRILALLGLDTLQDGTGHYDHANDAGIARQVIETRQSILNTVKNHADQLILSAGAPVLIDGKVAGVVVLSTYGGEIDGYLRGERRQILQMFFLAFLISVSLSILLANTIGRPLRDLAEAARRGAVGKGGRMGSTRIVIPDMTARPDEIGELSRQLRNMTTALYERIEANEAFAADVAHEIKNPLTSLGSAVESLSYVKDPAAQEKLLAIIRDDVRRMDRLVTDISNASRLDAELATRDMQTFDLCKLVQNVAQHQQTLAAQKGIRFVVTVPDKAIRFVGFESRLAQVLVNLISNAVSFVPDGGSITVSVISGRKQIRIVVEDTGPGIPEDNLQDIFRRFYSSRPSQEFGNNSGLGLAICKQIVEAHGGVIRAENVTIPGSDKSGGARFIVELPL